MPRITRVVAQWISSATPVTIQAVDRIIKTTNREEVSGKFVTACEVVNKKDVSYAARLVYKTTTVAN